MAQSRKGDYRMKKFIALVCMITCIFGLTACGSKETVSEYEQQKLDYAQQLASQTVVPVISQLVADENQLAQLSAYTPDELSYIFQNSYSMNAEGYAVMTALSSFDSALDELGTITGIGEVSAELDDKQIVVKVEVLGERKNAQAVVLFSNDMFMTLESAALNPVSSMGELMGRAALNTVIGMGTVFMVLILISLIISCFAVIPKLQAKLTKKNKKEEAVSAGIDSAVAQIVDQEETISESDDLELAAVIAAAIAASEGAVTTDGFVVRSIRRAGRR